MAIMLVIERFVCWQMLSGQNLEVWTIYADLVGTNFVYFSRIFQLKSQWREWLRLVKYLKLRWRRLFHHLMQL
ncbi:hypothetical protein BBG20_01945 [Pseudomonas aylmerensis]|uniref:Uncharacterized protein n=1 Tax=Pseudomonas aylmerensis TaxID=1869229 RepID=A0ABX2Z265_9PSED|nr:hypothetical protein BBG20_01945 [Pseudomonas aylmerensis]